MQTPSMWGRGEIGTTPAEGPHEALRELIGQFASELDSLDRRLGEVTRLAEKLLHRERPSDATEADWRAVYALRRLAAEYGRAHEAVW